MFLYLITNPCLGSPTFSWQYCSSSTRSQSSTKSASSGNVHLFQSRWSSQWSSAAECWRGSRARRSSECKNTNHNDDLRASIVRQVYLLPYADFLIALNVFAIFLEVLWVWCFATCSFISFIKTNLINLYIKKVKGRPWRVRESLGVFREWWCLNRMRWSSPLGEKHDSECWSDGSGRKVGGESGKDSSTISVASWDSAPDGLHKWKITLNLFSAFPEWVL